MLSPIASSAYRRLLNATVWMFTFDEICANASPAIVTSASRGHQPTRASAWASTRRQPAP